MLRSCDGSNRCCRSFSHWHDVSATVAAATATAVHGRGNVSYFTAMSTRGRPASAMPSHGTTMHVQAADAATQPQPAHNSSYAGVFSGSIVMAGTGRSREISSAPASSTLSPTKHKSPYLVPAHFVGKYRTGGGDPSHVARPQSAVAGFRAMPER